MMLRDSEDVTSKELSKDKRKQTREDQAIEAAASVR